MLRRNAILDALRSHAASRPGDTALVGDDGDVAYAELRRRVEAAAWWLRANGVERAGLWGENSADWIVADLAAWQANVTLVPLPPFFSGAQLAHAIDSAHLDHIVSCGADVFGGTVADGSPSPVRGIHLGRVAKARSDRALHDGDCKITFTSGTTGAPKGVRLTTRMLEAVTQALAGRIHGTADAADALRAHFTLLPLATLLENVAGVYVPLLLGRTVVVRSAAAIGLNGSSQLDVARLLNALHRDAPHSLIVLPQILRALVVAAERGRSLPASLRFVAVGGAPTPPALIARARALGIPVHEGYGLSECASVVALNAPSADRVGSVGRVLDHVRVRVEDGAIQVAGNVSPGYVGDGDGAGAAREWLDTGDLGRIDTDGFLYVTGRRKNVIITGYGRNVSPEWVEAELSLAPSIAQVMVIGDAQPFLSAIVVPAIGASGDALARDVAAANAGLPDYARVRRLILADAPFSLASRSLTANGRLCRDVIAARHAQQIEALYDNPPATLQTGSTHDVL